MGFLTERLSFDFGSSEIRIIKDGKLILSEKSQIAFDDLGKIIAFGDSVNKETHKNIVKPIKAGVITDFNAFEILLRGLIKKSANKNRKRIIAPSLISCCLIPDACSEVEIRAVRDSLEHAGSRKVYMIFSSFATVRGIGLNQKDTFLHIDAGAGKVAISIVANDLIHCPSKINFGANKLKDILHSFLKKTYGISCDTNTIEGILINYLTFYGNSKMLTQRIYGNDINKVNRAVEIDVVQLNQLLIPYAEIIINEIQLVLDSFNKPVDYLVITGGMSKLSGLRQKLEKELNIPVNNKSDSNYTLKGLQQFDFDFGKYSNALL